MPQIIRKAEAIARVIAPTKTAYNYITKDISPNLSLSVLKAEDYVGDIEPDHDWIYYVIAGQMTLKYSDQDIILNAEDSCMVGAGDKYQMSRTYEAVVVSQPAFGS